jgi:methylaspartate ammonia-lyase
MIKSSATDILQRIKDRKNGVTTSSVDSSWPSAMNAQDILERLKVASTGRIFQKDKMTFAFSGLKRPEILEWLEERQVKTGGSGNYTTIMFEDIKLAVEFKLRFIGI